MKARKPAVGRVIVLCLAMLCALSDGAFGAETTPEGPLPKYGKMTSKTKAVCVEMDSLVTEKGVEIIRAVARMWGDAATNRYAYRYTYARTDGGRTWTVEMGVLLTAGAAARWKIADGEVVSASRLPKAADAKVPLYARQIGPLAAVFDGLHGYPLLARELVLKPEPPPGHRKDGLDWFRAQKAEGGTAAFHRQFGLDYGSVWLGFSPKDGWVHSVAFVSAGGEADRMGTVSKLKRIDLRPALKGVFELPDKVKAKLAEHERNRRAPPNRAEPD